MKSWKDLAYNAYQLMKDYWTYDEIESMPIKGLLSEIDYFTPKMKELAKQQANARLQAELEGKRKQKKSRGRIY